MATQINLNQHTRLADITRQLEGLSIREAQHHIRSDADGGGARIYTSTKLSLTSLKAFFGFQSALQARMAKREAGLETLKTIIDREYGDGAADRALAAMGKAGAQALRAYEVADLQRTLDQQRVGQEGPGQAAEPGLEVQQAPAHEVAAEPNPPRADIGQPVEGSALAAGDVLQADATDPSLEFDIPEMKADVFGDSDVYVPQDRDALEAFEESALGAAHDGDLASEDADDELSRQLAEMDAPKRPNSVAVNTESARDLSEIEQDRFAPTQDALIPSAQSAGPKGTSRTESRGEPSAVNAARLEGNEHVDAALKSLSELKNIVFADRGERTPLTQPQLQALYNWEQSTPLPPATYKFLRQQIQSIALDSGTNLNKFLQGGEDLRELKTERLKSHKAKGEAIDRFDQASKSHSSHESELTQYVKQEKQLQNEYNHLNGLLESLNSQLEYKQSRVETKYDVHKSKVEAFEYAERGVETAKEGVAKAKSELQALKDQETELLDLLKVLSIQSDIGSEGIDLQDKDQAAQQLSQRLIDDATTRVSDASGRLQVLQEQESEITEYFSKLSKNYEGLADTYGLNSIDIASTPLENIQDEFGISIDEEFHEIHQALHERMNEHTESIEMARGELETATADLQQAQALQEDLNSISGLIEVANSAVSHMEMMKTEAEENLHNQDQASVKAERSLGKSMKVLGELDSQVNHLEQMMQEKMDQLKDIGDAKKKAESAKNSAELEMKDAEEAIQQVEKAVQRMKNEAGRIKNTQTEALASLEQNRVALQETVKQYVGMWSVNFNQIN